MARGGDGGRGAAVSGRERPPALPADLDRDGPVAGRVERGEHRPRRRERDLVLARAAAHDHRQTDALGHGVVEVVSVVAPVSRPTKIVTTDLGSAGVPEAGDWSRTMFSCAGSLVSCGSI